jgi:hypothetical protein
LDQARAHREADVEPRFEHEPPTRRISMPLIRARANRVRIVRHICRLQEPNRDTLVAYARFIGDTPDYVLNQLLATTLAKDKDFVAWRAEHPHEAVAASGPRKARGAQKSGSESRA